MAKHETPLLDQLESGPWPSFVSDLKQEAAARAKNEKNVEYQIPEDVVEDLLGILELSYKHGRTHWKHGGIVGVFGYGGGVIGRYCDQPAVFPGVAVACVWGRHPLSRLSLRTAPDSWPPNPRARPRRSSQRSASPAPPHPRHATRCPGSSAGHHTARCG